MSDDTKPIVKDFRPIESKGNYFKADLIEGDRVEVLVNGNKVIEFVLPYTACLKGYISGQTLFGSNGLDRFK